MGVCVFLYGRSGSGKSRSLKNFKEDEIFYVNVENKPLPFKTKFKYSYSTHDFEKIKNQLKRMGNINSKTAVIDDVTYLMTDYFMNHHRNMKGNASFEMYNQIADDMYSLINCIKHELPDDVIVYLIMHEDVNDYSDVAFRTIGKLLDQKVCLEGMSTIVIRCMADGKRHFFRTATTGSDITKTPEGMFSEEEIENDLKFVDTTIRQYYGFNESEDNVNAKD